MDLKHFPLRRFIVMFLGIVLLGCGIGLFKLSLTGNDPSSAMVMAVADTVGMEFAPMLLIFNCAWFLVEILWGRKLIGIGTFVNWFFTGTFASLFLKLIAPVTDRWDIAGSLPLKLGILCVGILVLSFACSLYQTADLGIAPYDSHSILLSRLTKIPYFWCRMLTDSACVAVALLFGGLIGIGTLVCALGLGPFISFFSKNLARRLCGFREDA